MQITNCKLCSKEFNYPPSEKRKYCSRSCANKVNSIIRHAKGHFGFVPGFHPKSEFKKGETRMVGENNAIWKGDTVGYTALHDWVKRNLGLPTECISCNDTLGAARFEWANISGEYKRDLDDWMMLCSICHRRHDDNTTKGWITRRVSL